MLKSSGAFTNAHTWETIAFDITKPVTDELSYQQLQLTEEEIDIVEAAQQSPDCKRVIQLTVAQQDGVAKLPSSNLPRLKPVVAEEPEDPIEEPVVKRAKKADAPPTAPKANFADVVNAWSDN
jgi:hypothetical protein